MEENIDQFLERFFSTHRGDRIIEEAKLILNGTAWQGYNKKIADLYKGLYCLSINQVSSEKIKDLDSGNIDFSDLGINVFDPDGNYAPISNRSELYSYIDKCQKANKIRQIIEPLFKLYDMHKDCVEKFEAYNFEQTEVEEKPKAR